MKKYIVPSMDVVELEAATLLAGSGEVSDNLGDDTPNGTNFHARSFSIWSEDEE